MTPISEEDINTFPHTGKVVLPYSTFLSPDTAPSRADDLQDLRDRVETLEQENANLRKKIADINKAIKYDFQEIGDLSRLVAVLYEKKTAPTEKTTKPYLDRIAARLVELRSTGRPAGLALQDVAKLLDLTKGRISHLRPAIEADRRFRIEQRGRKKIICLR